MFHACKNLLNLLATHLSFALLLRVLNYYFFPISAATRPCHAWMGMKAVPSLEQVRMARELGFRVRRSDQLVWIEAHQ
jgi:hypothetical protein